MLLAGTDVEILAHRLVERNIDRHPCVGQEPLWIGNPTVYVVGLETLVHPFELRRQSLGVARRGVAAHLMALHAVVVVGDDLERTLQMVWVQSLRLGQRAFVKPCIVDIRVLRPIHRRKVVDKRRRLV